MIADLSLLDFFYKSKLPIIYQSEMSECGLACLTMVLNYHGHKIDLNTIRRQHPISTQGCSLQDITRLAIELNLATRPVKLEVEQLVNLQVPCILHWNLDHFVVLRKATSKGVYVNDPAIGQRFITYDEVSKSFTGIALEISPTKGFEEKDEESKLKLSQFWNNSTGLKKALVNILLLSVLLQIFSIAIPFYSQLVIDDVLISQDLNLLNLIAIGFVLLVFIQVLTSLLRMYAVMHLGFQLSFQMTLNVFCHLLSLKGDFFSNRHIGDILSRFSSLSYIKNLLTTGVVSTIVDGAMALATFTMMYVYSPVLTLVVLTSVLLYLLIRIISYNSIKSVTEEEIIAKAEESTNFMETIRAVRAIKIFNREIDRLSIWQNKFASVINTGIKSEKLKIRFNCSHELILGLENVIVIYIGAQLILSNEFSVGMLFAFLAYKTNFSDKSFNLIEKIIEFKMLELHLGRISDIVLQEKEDVGSYNAEITLEGQLQCSNISFQYSPVSVLILNNLNLHVNKGESVAITGASGCGKTTLMNIFLGLLQPTNGSILIDGQNLNEIGLKNYRRYISAVTQDDILLSGSIMDNICFFDPKPDMDYVIECVKMAAIYKDIMKMPMKLNTLIGDMGTSLSGGQKQRVLLARALYKKPKILFLDEATSHLDSDSESLVNTAIKNLDITRVIIAHRKETIISADRVLKMENGSLSDITCSIKI